MSIKDIKNQCCDQNLIFNQINNNFQLFESISTDRLNRQYFYFGCKMIVNQNNSFQLLEKIVSIGKQYLYVYHVQEQVSKTSSKQIQQLNVLYENIQNPQSRIQLKKYTSLNIIQQNDTNFHQYLKSIFPQYVKLTNQQYLIIVLKNHQQYQMLNILLPNLNKANQFVYGMALSQCLRIYDQQIQTKQIQINYRLIKSLSNVKLGIIQINPHEYGYGWKYQYNQQEQEKQISFFIHYSSIFINQLSNSFIQQSSLKLLFKFIDNESINYGKRFINAYNHIIRKLHLNKCELNQQNLQLLMSIPSQKIQFINFKYLTHLYLNHNKFTDNVFNILKNLIQKQSIPQIYYLSLQGNYITLSQNIHRTLIQLLQKVKYRMNINLQQNRVKSLKFFNKYFIQADIRSILPIQFVNLKKNKINKSQRQVFIQNYMKKIIKLQENMKEIDFIIDFGIFHYPNNRYERNYMLLLENYYKFYNQHNDINEQIKSTSIILNSNSNINTINSSNLLFTYLITKQRSYIHRSSSHLSVPSPNLSPNHSQVSVTNNKQQMIAQLLQILTKLYIYNDYKQIQKYKKQLKQKYQITEDQIKQSIKKEIKQKKKEEDKIIYKLNSVWNMIEHKNFGYNENQKNNINQFKININKQLDELVGIIRRRGLQGRASYFTVYLKYKTDQLINQYISSQKQFNIHNPYVEYLKNIYENKITVYSNNKIKYQQLQMMSEQQLKRRFFQIKQSYNFIQNQRQYDILKFILINKEMKIQRLSPMLVTIFSEPKLIFMKIIKNYQNFTQSQISQKLIITKNKISDCRQNLLNIKKVQLMSRYDLKYYTFNNNVNINSNLSQYINILSCLPYNQQKMTQIIQFIQVVKNFMTFLYYTPYQISQQTITYLNYIVTYLNQIQLQDKEDYEYKQFLIQQLYLHMMTFKLESNNLIKGILINVFQYLTQRLYCRSQIQKYIIAFLLKYQTTDIQNSKIIINKINKDDKQNNINHNDNHQINKINWLITNHLLLDAFKNNGSVSIFLKIQYFQQLHQLKIDPNLTFSQIFIHLQNSNEFNYFKYGINKQQLSLYWFYSIENIENKFKYYQSIGSFKYLGQIIQQKYADKQKIIINLRRNLQVQKQLNIKILQTQFNQTQIIRLFEGIFQNLQISLYLLTNLRIFDQIIDRKQQKTLSIQQLSLQIISKLLFIKLQILSIKFLFPLKQKQFRSKYTNQQQFYQYYFSQQQILSKSLMQKIQQNAQYSFNLFDINIESKYIIMQNIRNYQQDQNIINLTLKDKILQLIVNDFKDIIYVQLLINNQNNSISNQNLKKNTNLNFVAINHRMLASGKIILQNDKIKCKQIQIKCQFQSYFKSIIDLQINIDKTNKTTNLFIQKIQFHNENKIQLISYNMNSQSSFLLQAFNYIYSLSKITININDKLFQSMIKNYGIAKVNSKIYKKQIKQQKNIKSYMQIQQKFIHFSLSRNKENNKQNISKQQQKNQIPHIQEQKINENNNNIQIKAQQAIQFVTNRDNNNNNWNNQDNILINKDNIKNDEIFSRKPSSRKSLIKSKSSRRQLSKQNSPKNNKLTIKNHQKTTQTQQLHIKSQQCISINHQIANIQKNNSSQQINQITSNQLFDKIIKQKINSSQIKNQNQQQQVQIINQQKQQVLTNQRKSKRDLPKRRSSREKS